MCVPTTTNEHLIPQDLPVALDYNDVAEPAEGLPAYSREPTEDGYAYDQHTEIEEKKGFETNIEGATSESAIIPICDLPGYASESALRRGLQVPTRSRLITSGFTFPEILSQCDITEEQWSNFTQELTKEAEMTPVQWTTTVGKGFGTFFVGGIFFGFLGVIPAAIAGYKVRQSNEEKNFSIARQKNVLQEILNRWNEAVFKPKGLLIRVDLPNEAMDMATMDLLTRNSGWEKKSNSGCCNSASKKARAERWVTTKDLRTQSRAAKKGRIVILPLSHTVQERSPLRPVAAAQPVNTTSPVHGSIPVYQEGPDAVATYVDEKRGGVEPVY
jgi:Domain of unknown function (DUF4646)